MGEQYDAPMALLTASTAFLAAFCLAPQGAPSQQDPDLSLIRALCAEPRVVGTPGYERGLELVAERLEAAGLPVERSTVTAFRSIPRRSEVTLFADAGAPLAFGGLRERWSPDAPRPMALPAAFASNVEEADVRAPIVDLGAGLEADLARAAEQRVRVEGSVALITVAVRPADRAEPLGQTVNRVKGAGCAGLIVAPALREGDPAHGMALGRAPGTISTLSLPTVAVRAFEAEQIRSRLRARRVRGPDGKAVTVKVGPGPVEARIQIECPKESLEGVPTLIVPGAEALSGQPALVVNLGESLDAWLGGAASLERACAALAASGSARRTVRFEPTGVWTETPADRVPDLVSAAAAGLLGPGEDPMDRWPILDNMDSSDGTGGLGDQSGRMIGTVPLASPLPCGLERRVDRAMKSAGPDISNWMDTAERWMVHTLSRRVAPSPGSEPKAPGG